MDDVCRSILLGMRHPVDGSRLIPHVHGDLNDRLQANVKEELDKLMPTSGMPHAEAAERWELIENTIFEHFEKGTLFGKSWCYACEELESPWADSPPFLCDDLTSDDDQPDPPVVNLMSDSEDESNGDEGVRAAKRCKQEAPDDNAQPKVAAAAAASGFGPRVSGSIGSFVLWMAGTSCVDWALYGHKRGAQGPMQRPFLIWIAEILKELPHCIIF
jgi:hypothetical protein